jgi:esterase/lipase
MALAQRPTLRKTKEDGPILPPIVVVMLILVIALALGWAVFRRLPRTPVDLTIRFDPAAMGDDVEAYLNEREAAVAGIRPGLRKQIVWADPTTRRKTLVAFIYVHGFSASPGELRPVPEIVAQNFGGNLFFTRLAGHGATPEAMGSMTVNALVNDLAEAVAIGEQLGERVVLLGTSTGAALATWAMAQPAFRDRIAAAVLMSPNYGVLAKGFSLLTWPGAPWLVRRVLGPTRSFVPTNPLHAAYWTTLYPVEALLPMAEIVRLAVRSPVEHARAPALFLICPDDTVVDPAITRRIAARWGADSRLEEIGGVEDPSRHVLAGDAMSPGTTRPVAAIVSSWLRHALAEPS